VFLDEVLAGRLMWNYVVFFTCVILVSFFVELSFFVD
jgi:hypothetical protein